MVLKLGARVVELTNPGQSSTTYVATIDGKRVPIRYRFQSRHARTYDPKPFLQDWTQADTMSMLLLYHAANVVPEPAGDALVFSFVEKRGACTTYVGTIEMAIRENVLVVDVMLESQQLRLDLGGPILEFTRIEDGYNSRYAAEVDGQRVPIRMHRLHANTGWNQDETSESNEEGMAVNLWDLEHIFSAPKRDGDAFVFEIGHEGGYQRSTVGTVTLAYRDGIVHWDAELRDE